MSVRNGLDVDDVEGMLEERDIERGEGHRERESDTREECII